MTDSEAKALSMRIKRSIAREIETGVDNPIVADIRKIRREMVRKCDHDVKKYARYHKELTKALERRKHLPFEERERLFKQDEERAAKIVAQMGSKDV